MINTSNMYKTVLDWYISGGLPKTPKGMFTSFHIGRWKNKPFIMANGYCLLFLPNDHPFNLSIMANSATENLKEGYLDEKMDGLINGVDSMYLIGTNVEKSAFVCKRKRTFKVYKDIKNREIYIDKEYMCIYEKISPNLLMYQRIECDTDSPVLICDASLSQEIGIVMPIRGTVFNNN